ncbi:chromosome segregation protein SMC [Pseudomonas fulva]|nr:AAA family ATPase [Pseudomonas fulva]MBF8781651.1 chromosome segregation protein SMC [Pseudomonas fulva]
MKILAIRLKNLASLAGPVDIDFTAEPLASAGLFAITGATGAGKSTLLDALCLALFGNVPRLGDVSREAKVPDADGDLATWDPRTLLRRGTGSGYAEVDFVGTDGHRYRARWEANRARDKAAGKLQHSRQSLHDLDTGQLLSNQSKSEYKQLLEARLGLNFEQFTRAVMLAQSEFSAFLKADDKERSELLEKLTNTSIYTRLGQRAFGKAKQAGELHRDLQARAVHLMPLAEQARAELEQRLEQALGEYRDSQTSLRQLELQRAWLREQAQLQAQLAAAQQALQTAQHEAARLSAQRRDVQLLQRLAPQRHQFQRQRLVAAQLAPLAAALELRRHSQVELQACISQQQQTLEAARLTCAQAQAQQAQSAASLRQAYASQDHLARLALERSGLTEAIAQADQALASVQAQLHEGQARQRQDQEQLAAIEAALAESAALERLGNAWQAYRGQLQQLLQVGDRLAQGRRELPALQEQASQAEAQLLEHQQACALLFQEAEVEPQALPEQLDLLGNLLQQNRKQQRAVEALARLHDHQRELEQSDQAVRERQQHALQERQRHIVEGQAVKAELEAAEQALNITQQLLERQRLARSASVEQLRAQLQPGEPCPVCGSAEHPYRASEPLLERLDQHDQAEQARAKATVDTLKARLEELRTLVGVLNGQIKEYQRQQRQLAEQLQPLAEQLAAHSLWPALLDLDGPARGTWLKAQQRRLDDEISRDERRQAQLLDVQKQAARFNQQLQSASQTQQQTRQRLDQQQQALAADTQNLEQALAAFSELLPEARLQGLREQPAQAFLELDQQVTLRLRQQAQQQEHQQQRQQRQQHLASLDNELQACRQHQLELARQLDDLDAQRRQLDQRLADLLNGHASADDWQHQLQQQLQQARDDEAAAVQQLQQAREQLITLSGELKAEQTRHAALQEEDRQLQHAIAGWRANHAELDDAALERLLVMDDAHLEQISQAVQAADKAVEQARVLLEERDARLRQHATLVQAPPSAENLEHFLAQLQERLAGQEQRCAELRAEQAEDQRRRLAYQALAAEIEAAHGQWQRWARLSALIGSASGDTFRKLAQGYNLDLLLHHANGQLRQLARRYRLKRGGSSLGLLVLDTEMGDELRSVHSLSGGETFLVSLALALGLASMASSTLRIESLFIDEGFGSLDPESLQLAMDALDGLQAQGRKVAVISHVQEMHERIPVQIQVRRRGNGLSDVQVVG